MPGPAQSSPHSPSPSAGDGTALFTAPVRYIVSASGKPHAHTAALTGGLPELFFETVQHKMTIHNARRIAETLSLDRQGFELHRHPTRAANLYDDPCVEGTHYPEIESLLKAVTGATRVLIFDHTRRTDEPREGYREPASRAHNDYTETSGPQRLRDLLGDEEAEALGDTPVAQINIWRPLQTPVQRCPLALLDASTAALEDLVATDYIYPERIGEIYHVGYNPGHRWYYFPDMTSDEVVLIKGYDSRDDGRARFTPHAAFDHPDTPPSAPPRESLELRAFVIFDQQTPEAP